jgi:hypothetical protein
MTIKWNTGNAATRFRLNKKKKKAPSRKRQAASPPQAGVGKKLFTK